MFFVAWKGFKKVTTVCCSSAEAVFDVVNLLEDKKIYYKVSDRLGIIVPRYLGYGDMHHWLTEVNAPLDEVK